MFAQIVNFFLLPIYTRFLTLEDYGTMALLAILSTVLVPIACLGLSPAIFKFFREPDIDQKQLLSNAVLTTGLSSVIMLIITIYFDNNIASVLLSSETKDSILLIRLTLFTAALMSISTMFLTSLRANRQPIATVVITGISLSIQVSTSIILVVFWNMGILGVTISVLSGAMISFMLLVIVSRRSISFKLDRNLLIKMFSFGLYHVPSQIITLLNIHTGQYILKNLVSVRGLGLYSIANRFMMPVTLIGASIQYAHTAIFFQILKEDDKPKDTLRSIAIYFVTGISFLWVAASLWGAEVLRIMTTPSFHEAYVYIGPIGIIPVLLLLYTFLASGIDSGKDLRPYLIVNIVGLITLIGASYVFIDRFGILGAILGAVLSRLVMIFIAVRFAQNRLRIEYNYLILFLIILIGCLFSIAPIHIENYSLIYRLLINTILTLLYPMLCLLVISIYKSERYRLIRGSLHLKGSLIARLKK